MKTKIIKFTLFIFILCQLSVTPQKMMEQLNECITNYTILSDGTVINDSIQYIVKRAEFETEESAYTMFDKSYAYGYGYGYESFHLEFAGSGKIISTYRYHKRRREKYYDIIFYDEQNNLLATKRLDLNRIKILGNEDNKTKHSFFYSIDIQGIPLILLNATSKVDIIKISETQDQSRLNNK